MEDIVGYIGTFLIGCNIVPQVYKTYEDHDAEGLSMQSLLLESGANAAFITYGALINSMPLMIGNSFILTMTCALMFAKHKYQNSYKPLSSGRINTESV